MLAIESNNVIGIRLSQFLLGGSDAYTEAALMVSEKIDAAAESCAILAAGGTGLGIIEHYRKIVAANAERLSG